MTKITLLVLWVLGCLVAAGAGQAAEGGRRMIIYDGIATQVGAAPEPSSDLWVTVADLTRATRFVIKPQGVCREELCYPIPKARKSEFIVKKTSGTWFNLSEFARLLRQPVAFDNGHSTWYFGPPQTAQNEFVQTLEAPNFTLPDVNGKMHSLADFRGKKVLLITWASW